MKHLLLVLPALFVSLSSSAQIKQFKNALEENSVNACDKFINKYPSSEFTEEVAFKRASLINTSEAYEDFVKKYPKGNFTVRALDLWSFSEFKKAEEINSIDCYEKFLKAFPQSEFVRQIKKYIEIIDFNVAKKENTRTAFQSFLDKYPDGFCKGDAEKSIEQFGFDLIKNSLSQEELEGYLARNASGFFRTEIEQRITEIKMWNEVEKDCGPYAYTEYIRLYPNGIYIDLARSKFETAMWNDLEINGTTYKYEEYIKKYPTGIHAVEANERLENLMWVDAKTEDWYSTYGKFINRFPNSIHTKEATDRIAYLKSQIAVVVIKYPQEVEQTLSPYSNVGSPFWSWNTVFKETGGKIGFKVKGIKGYIIDPKGTKWVYEDGSFLLRGTVEVPAGGSGSDATWSSSTDHVRCHGNEVIIWSGEDAGGHAIEITETVHLKHTFCLGPKK